MMDCVSLEHYYKYDDYKYDDYSHGFSIISIITLDANASAPSISLEIFTHAS
jgi:hypothetical protein